MLQTLAGFDYSFMRFRCFVKALRPAQMKADSYKADSTWLTDVHQKLTVFWMGNGSMIYGLIWPSFVGLVLSLLELLRKRIWPQFRPLLQLGRSLAIMVAMTAMINRFRIGTIRLVSHWESWGYEWNYVYLCMICLSNESLHKGFSLQWSRQPELHEDHVLLWTAANVDVFVQETFRPL